MSAEKGIDIGAMFNDSHMKPVVLLPNGTMGADDIKRLNDNGICTVECDDPAKVKFLDPIPAIGSRTQIEQAAIMLSRKIMGKDFWSSNDTRKIIIESYFDILIKGTALDTRPTQQEQEKKAYDEAKLDEMRKLAREEARAERAAAKSAKDKK